MLKSAKRSLIILCIIFIAASVSAEDNGVVKLTYGEDRWISLHYLLQAQGFSQNGYEATADTTRTDSWTKSFLIRRSRIILNGQVTKNIDFFMQTDDLMIGSQGAGSQYTTSTTYTTEAGDTVTVKDSKGTFTQDAYINYKLAETCQIAVGLMPLPFMHQNMESAASLLGIDYNSAIVPLESSSNNWRDAGVLMRGMYSQFLDYRIGVFRGQARDYNDSSVNGNSDSSLRLCGRVQFNLADAETGFFYSGNYLGKKSVVSFAGALDYQHNASRINGNVCDYYAWTGDVTVDYKVSSNLSAAFQAAYVNLRNEPGSTVHGQYGYYAQLGVLFYEKYQPVMKYQFWDGDSTYRNDVKIDYISAGFNYFIYGHNANIKFEYQTPLFFHHDIAGDKKATIQCQLFL